MTTTISGLTGVSQVQDGAVTTAKLADGAVTGAKISGNQSGNAPVYGARAWAVFDGSLTGTNAPTSGGNVTSVTRNATGDYTINFATAMPDADYALSGVCTGANVSGIAVQLHAAGAGSAPTLKTATQVRIYTANTSSANDGKQVTVTVFR